MIISSHSDVDDVKVKRKPLFTGRMPRRKSQSDWDDGVEEVLSKKQNHTLSLSPC